MANTLHSVVALQILAMIQLDEGYQRVVWIETYSLGAHIHRSGWSVVLPLIVGGKRPVGRGAAYVVIHVPDRHAGTWKTSVPIHPFAEFVAPVGVLVFEQEVFTRILTDIYLV